MKRTKVVLIYGYQCNETLDNINREIRKQEEGEWEMWAIRPVEAGFLLMFKKHRED